MPGLLDTVKFKALCQLHEKDREHLRRRGFQHQKHVRVEEDDIGQNVSIREMYYHEKTGLRVLVDDFETKVEGSIPRQLGLTNEKQESITESDARTAMHKMTYDLLPYTSGENLSCWGLTRLDLARNFEGDIPQVVNVYGNLKHPEIRRQTRTVFSESVSYYGTSREIVVYDKGLEMGESVGVLGRAECRWKGVKGLEKVVAQHPGSKVYLSYDPARFCLPVYLKNGFDNNRIVNFVETDFKKLNRAMRADLERLGAPGPVKVFSSAVEVALDAMTAHPDEYMGYFLSMTQRSQERWRKRLKQYKARRHEVDLVKLIDWEDAA